LTPEQSVDTTGGLEQEVTAVRDRLSRKLNALARRGHRVQALLHTAEHTARDGIVVLGALGALGLFHFLTRPHVRAVRVVSSPGPTWTALRIAGAALLAGVAGFVAVRQAMHEDHVR